ncbi:MAG TPA: class I SAM-dependent methyltransferase [Chitinophagaceae bacterium]|jgi:S-adenosylmethionine-diacylgycerolhomoserine-N-methlytransferase|nr:class I SAM-dependent methyltransferase [Chitinophagaceae bacterium]
MKWYDLFSNFYDSSLEKLYFESRKRAIELLDLKDGLTVIDVACGTGANFLHIKKDHPDIMLYGTDYSGRMLQKAQALIKRNGWSHTSLFRADARTLTLSSIQEYTGKELLFDRVLCVLGLSVIPGWETVLRNLVGLLKENGKIVVMDVFAEKRTVHTWLVEKIAKADLDRKIGPALERMTSDFYLEYMPVKESKVGGRLFVAVGTKRRS